MNTQLKACLLVFLTTFSTSIFPSAVFSQSFVDRQIADQLEEFDRQESKIYYGVMLEDFILLYGKENIKGKLIVNYNNNIINKENTLSKQQEINPKLTGNTDIILLSPEEYQEVKKDFKSLGINKGWWGMTVGSYLFGTFLDMTFDAVGGGASQMWNNYSNNQPIFYGVGERMYNNFWGRFYD